MTMATAARLSGFSWSRSTGVLSLWLCLLLSLSIQLTLAQENGDNDDNDAATTEATGTTVSTTPESFNVKLIEKEITTSSITIGWRVPEGYGVVEYEVVSRKSTSNATTFSGPIDPEEKQYLIDDLTKSTEYEVCVEAKVEGEDDIPEEDKKVCDMVSTIPLIQTKSLIILFCVLGYVALMILIGYCVWKKDTKKALAEMEDEDEEGEKMKPGEEPQTYLGTPANNAPKSSIEDQDIPYITPPVEQLSPTEKDQYKKKSNSDRKLDWWYNS